MHKYPLFGSACRKKAGIDSITFQPQGAWDSVILWNLRLVFHHVLILVMFCFNGENGIYWIDFFSSYFVLLVLFSTSPQSCSGSADPVSGSPPQGTNPAPCVFAVLPPTAAASFYIFLFFSLFLACREAEPTQCNTHCTWSWLRRGWRFPAFPSLFLELLSSPTAALHGRTSKASSCQPKVAGIHQLVPRFCWGLR